MRSKKLFSKGRFSAKPFIISALFMAYTLNLFMHLLIAASHGSIPKTLQVFPSRCAISSNGIPVPNPISRAVIFFVFNYIQ
jgi:hypothetical protein